MRRRCALLLLLIIGLLSPLLSGCADAPFDGLTVEVLDVGQSDCTLITYRDTVLMIDAATATERSTVQRALKERDIEQIDLLLLTHPHEDHMGNARMLIEVYAVGALILPPIQSEDVTWTWTLQTAAACGVTVHTVSAGQAFAVGEAEMEILQVGTDVADPNNSSIVLRLCYGETSFLFTGDNEEAGETALLSGIPADQLDCDFLKAGHHGSENATGEALLEAVRPAHVAISCGRDNSYGFPAAALLERLQAVGAEWHRTDKEGTLCYISDGQQVIFVNGGERHG